MPEITTQAARLIELLELNNFQDIKDTTALFSVHELVDIIPILKQNEQLLIFKALDRGKRISDFENLEGNLQEELLDVLPYRQLQLILNDMSPDKRTALLEELPFR
jgi:magnesium transporter